MRWRGGARRPRPGRWFGRGFGAALLLPAALLIAEPRWAAAQERTGPYAIYFAGRMTDNHWEDVFRPGSLDLLDSWFAGVGVGYEWPTPLARATIGLEVQAVGHVGRQDHLEFNLPVVVRYYPARPVIPALSGMAFGLGLSTTTQDPQTEIDRDGETSKTLVYWMGELEFRLPREDLTLSFRLHHRSDAYGLLDTDSGSNALALGLRHRF